MAEQKKTTSLAEFGRFLGHGHDGKVRAWKKGQWPSAEDCWKLEKLLGFNLRWLVTGKGKPFGDTPPEAPTPPPPAPDLTAELERLRKELEESNRLNRQLVTKLLVDGAGDKHDAQGSDVKAAG